MRPILFTFPLACLLSASAFAAEAGRSEATFQHNAQALHGTATFAWRDLDAVLEIDLDRDGRLSSRELAVSDRFLGEYAETLYECQQDGTALTSVNVDYHYDATSESIAFQLHYELQKPDPVNVTFQGHRDFPVGHQQHLQVLDSRGNTLSQSRIGDPQARPFFPTPQPIVAPMPQVPAVHLAQTSPKPRTIRQVNGGWIAFAIALGLGVWFIRSRSSAVSS